MGYMGSKNGAGVYQAIINLMPPHDLYVEPFLGSGAVFDRKAPAPKNILIDKSEFCMQLQSVNGFPPSPIVKDIYDGSYIAGNGWDAGTIDVNALPAVELLNVDALLWLSKFKPPSNTVIYCDPPYMHSTRTSNKRYEHELTDEEHEELLTLLCSKDANVLLSGYRNELYESMLQDWHSIDFRAMTRGGVRTETVWCNYKPNEIHWHTYAGKDATERQRIKRKAERWRNNFAALPIAERQAVFNALLEVE